VVLVVVELVGRLQTPMDQELLELPTKDMQEATEQIIMRMLVPLLVVEVELEQLVVMLLSTLEATGATEFLQI
jgi:hypothetical protein